MFHISYLLSEEHEYINCAACLSLAELDQLNEQIDIERDTELTIFDLEGDTVMSYNIQTVQQLNLTYTAPNWTEVKDLFPKIDKKVALSSYL